jgi:hypothetical protein
VTNDNDKKALHGVAMETKQILDVYSSDLDPHSGHPDPSAAKRVDLNSGILTPLLFFATIGEGYFNELLV